MFKTQSVIRQALSQKPLFSRSLFASAIQNKSTSLSSLPYLHAHPSSDNKKYAISYVSEEDLKNNKSKDMDSELIIGWSNDKENLDPKTFLENSKFVDFMTKVLKESIHTVDDSNLKALADWQKDGWLHIGDERNPPAWGRINFPEDIIGSVEVNGGVIKAGSYQPMPAHRMVTNDGIFQLSQPLTKCVVDAAKKKALT